jgi:hypothetical protein
MPVTEAEAAAALPPEGWVRRYVIHAAKQTTAPLVYHIGVGLTTLTATAPLGYGTHYAGKLRANNFCLLVGRSGEDNKSSALNVGRRLLFEAAPPLVGDFPGSPEGLIDSLAIAPSQLIPISEFGKFLSSAQGGYFEPTKTLLADLWDCLDSNTVILHSDGWKNVTDVKINDKVWALDPETGKLVLSKVLDVGERAVRLDEKMVTLKGHNHDIRTTEGHRYYIKYRDPSRSYTPSPSYLVKTGAEMAKRKSAFFLPFSGEVEQPGIDITDDELRAMAFTKTLSPNMMGMNRAQFEMYWRELLLADGEQVGEGLKGLLWSTDLTFVDRLQHLAVINGFSTQYGTRELPAGRTAYRMSVGNKRHVCTDPGNKKSIGFEFDKPDPDERVWCVTTEHGTLVTRRNGKVVILGNCDPTQRRRANDKTVRVDDPRLSIMAACSIPYLEKHTLAEDWTGGFMGRWMVLYGRRERSDPDPVGCRKDVPWLVAGLKDRATTPSAGWCIGFDKEAKERWSHWYHDVMARQLPGNIVGIRARAPTIARKIALIYGWDYGGARDGDPWRIDMRVLEPAIKLTELHIKSLVHLAGVIAEHPDARLRRSVLMAIDQKGGVATLGEIIGILKMRKRPIIEMLDAALEEGIVKKLDTKLGVMYEFGGLM